MQQNKTWISDVKLAAKHGDRMLFSADTSQKIQELNGALQSDNHSSTSVLNRAAGLQSITFKRGSANGG